MNITASIESTLPYFEPYYIQQGNQPIPVSIKVVNNTSTAKRIKTLYLVNEDDVVSLGLPDIRKQSINLDGGNNVIPAATTATITGSVPLPSGSDDDNTWVLLPLQYTSSVGVPPVVIDGIVPNLGYWGLDYALSPPEPVPGPYLEGSANIGANPSPSPIVGYTASCFVTGSDGGGAITLGLILPPSYGIYTDFTFEWWSWLIDYGVPVVYDIYPLQFKNVRGIVWQNYSFFPPAEDPPQGSGVGHYIGYTDTGHIGLNREGDDDGGVNFFVATSSVPVPLNSWHHQAVVRSGSTISFYLDGTRVGNNFTQTTPAWLNVFEALNSQAAATYPAGFFDDYPQYAYLEGAREATCNGYFQQLRWSNVARYTGSSFVVPTAPFSAAYDSGGGNIPFTQSQTTAGSQSYSATWIPQTDALTYLNSEREYNINIGARVMIDNNPSIIVAQTASFQIGIDTPQIYTLGSPYTLWSLSNNARPPENIGFDFQLQPTVYLQNGESLPLPQAFNYYSSSDPSVAAVVEFSEGINATTGSLFSSSAGFILNPYATQISASGGSVIINGTGSCIIGVWDDPNNYGNDPYAAVEITVVDALPVSLQVYPQIRNVFSGSQYGYEAYLYKSNGSRVDVSNEVTWTTNVGSDIANIDSSGILSITGSYGNIQITAVSGGLSNSSQAVIIN